MPLSQRGREILKRLPAAVFRGSQGIGCEIVRQEARCVGCGLCVDACPSGACTRGSTIDLEWLLRAPRDTRRGALGAALSKLARHAPKGKVEVPDRVRAYRSIEYRRERCLGCGSCARACPTGAVEKSPPEPRP